jgi:hypothetical protein
MEEHGHVLLLGIFDSVDDTKFISKSILEVKLTIFTNYQIKNIQIKIIKGIVPFN